jgi:leucyl/phenylalanyl-tRNA--protein transferase
MAEPDGLLAVGGDLRPERLLQAYAGSIFPWYSEGSPILWWSPPERALFRPGDERFSRRTAQALRNRPFEVRRDTCFEAVIRACARVPRTGQDDTWITRAMVRAYVALHQEGYAHSFEAFRNGELVGGLYGISLGAAFFGESMFTLESYASRAAFADLCRTAWGWGFHFIDGQLPNDNLQALGARVIDRDAYLALLAEALEQPTRRGRWN